MAMEFLSRSLLGLEMRGVIHGIKVARQAPTISYLFFIDDIFLFCRANGEEASAVAKLLEDFGKWSGLVMNGDKSGIIFSRNVADKDE